MFERRLIESYIAENGKDPVTGEELSTDELIELKTARVVRPRPPTLTSIPSLLSVFQNEWDALALETYTLRQQLAQTRQELSTALYQHDAAVRVIARLSRERDDARDALSKVSITKGGAASNGDHMQVDGEALPESIAAKVDATQEKYDPPVLGIRLQCQAVLTCSTQTLKDTSEASCPRRLGNSRATWYIQACTQV